MNAYYGNNIYFNKINYLQDASTYEKEGEQFLKLIDCKVYSTAKKFFALPTVLLKGALEAIPFCGQSSLFSRDYIKFFSDKWDCAMYEKWWGGPKEALPYIDIFRDYASSNYPEQKMLPNDRRREVLQRFFYEDLLREKEALYTIGFLHYLAKTEFRPLTKWGIELILKNICFCSQKVFEIPQLLAEGNQEFATFIGSLLDIYLIPPVGEQKSKEIVPEDVRELLRQAVNASQRARHTQNSREGLRGRLFSEKMDIVATLLLERLCDYAGGFDLHHLQTFEDPSKKIDWQEVEALLSKLQAACRGKIFYVLKLVEKEGGLPELPQEIIRKIAVSF